MLEGLKSKVQKETEPQCSSREMTLQELLESRRNDLVDALKEVNDCIKQIQYMNPDCQDVLKRVMRQLR